MFGQKRVGILGTGAIAEIMVRTLKGTKGVTCYAVASRTLEKAERFAKENKIKCAYGSYQELCMDPKIDLVYVATPHSEHFENACLAMEYGKNVLCEKAFALNEKQAIKMFEVAAENNVLLTEAMWTRFLPLGKKLKEIVASNKIGDVQMVTADLSFNIAWKNRIQNKSLGGGALLDLGIYGLTFASMVLGEDVVDISSQAVLNGEGVDLQTSISLRYRNGQMAVITCSAVSNGSNKGMIFGTGGHIEVDMINNFEIITVFNGAGEKDGFYKKEKQVTGYEYEVMAVMNALSENWKECPEMPKAKTLKLMNMMDFIRNQIGVKYPQDDIDFDAMDDEELLLEDKSADTAEDNADGESSQTDEALIEDKAAESNTDDAATEDVADTSDNGEAAAGEGSTDKSEDDNTEASADDTQN